MATVIQQRKLDKAFNHLDADRSGYVEEQDLTDLGLRLLANFGVTHEDPKARRIADGFSTFWVALAEALDADGDRRLSPQEYADGMIDAFAQGDGAFDRHFRPGAIAVLELADTDDDGFVNPAEFAVMQRAFGTPEDEIGFAFDQLDTDRDGRLSVDEMIVAVEQFYIGADENAVGNWFFGRY
ncbi:Ca2+-binding EF-hand superfamily protein [Allocatelliglobosispora scoriae]|uniref:Ca2+-binding EF-hand superfamily protein n=1 Tax=Allocatelliglobosispora scoriae TaxID=643052 RepID=A0A841BZX2_9ACTN|nr:EF-hand domain-containing protein [Allocatelliglobosispora scoriae]MBB5872649.1 Ca2+-binding EF-hand superfamily protein [Allocatelliglobosispora scoriae]